MVMPKWMEWVHLPKEKVQELRALYLWYWEPDWMHHDILKAYAKHLYMAALTNNPWWKLAERRGERDG